MRALLQPNDFMKLRQKPLEVLRYVMKRRCFSWYSAQAIHHFAGQRYAFACVKPVSVNMVLFCIAGRRRYGMCHVGLLCAWIFFCTFLQLRWTSMPRCTCLMFWPANVMFSAHESECISHKCIRGYIPKPRCKVPCETVVIVKCSGAAEVPLCHNFSSLNI